MADVKDGIVLDCVGLDFGTTNSSVAYWDGSCIQLIDLDDGPIMQTKIKYKQVVIKSIKRIISNPESARDWGLEWRIENGIPEFLIDETWKSIIDISADILKNIRFKVNNKLKKNIRNTVLTVPARYNECQRQWVVEAATNAGWKVVRVIAEPTAGFLSCEMPNGTYGIYDIGGGTFDFTLLRKEEDVIHVLGTTGDTELGGDHLDLLAAAELKIPQEEARILRESGKGPEQIYKSMIEKSISKCKDLLKQINCKPDGIILIGGTSQMGLVREHLAELEVPLTPVLNPQLAVAKGAAVQARQIMEGDLHLLIDVAPLSIGVEVMNNLVEWLIYRNSPLPIAKKMVFTNSNPEQTHIIFNVVQGDSILAKECRLLGTFSTDINVNKRNQAKIELNFMLDLDGMLHINCLDLDTGEARAVQFNSGEGLTITMLERMLAQGESNIAEKEEVRKLSKICAEVDNIISAMAGEIAPDLLERRNSLNTASDAAVLFDELTKLYNHKIEQKLCGCIDQFITK